MPHWAKTYEVVSTVQAGVHLVILIVLAFILHRVPGLTRGEASGLFSLLGVGIGWELAVMYYRALTVWRGKMGS